MGEQLLRIVSGLLVGIWVTRYLGPEQFGLLSYAIAFVSVFGGLSKLGLDGILVREFVGKPDDKENYLATAFVLKVSAGLFAILFVAGALFFSSSDTRTNFLVCIVSISLIFQSFDVIEYYFQSQVKAKVVSVCKVIQLVLSLCLKIALILNQASLIWFAYISVFDTFTLAMGYFFSYRIHNVFRVYGKFRWDIARQLLKDSWPLIFAGVGFVLFSNVDVIMLKKMTTEHDVGIYAAAYRLVIAWHFFPGLVLNSLFPAVLSKKQESVEYNRRKVMVTSFLLWSAIAIALFASLFSTLIVKVLYGSQFGESAVLLAILIWANVFVFFNSAWSFWHIAENKSKWVLLFQLISAGAAILLNYLLIPFFGNFGSALALPCALFFSFFIFSIVDKNIPVLFWKSIVAIFIYEKTR